VRFGLGIGDFSEGGESGVARLIEQAHDVAERGFVSAWMSQIFGFDALTALAVVGSHVPRIELGTAVVPTYPRHPMMLAAQALTVDSATDHRLILGIGLSHQIVIESMLGYSFDKPARHMREYLSILMPLLHSGSASFAGETLKANVTVSVPGGRAMPVLLAALAPTMLKLAGSVADGTVTWMTGPGTVESHIVPRITAAAAEAGKPSPRVVVGLPVCVTDDPDAARELAAKVFSVYGQLPSYRAMLDKEGAAGPADVAIVGTEEAVAKGVQRVAAAGATDFLATPYGSSKERHATIELLTGLAADSRGSAAGAS
jgi:F420-dependent oxidoreductase-like protein